MNPSIKRLMKEAQELAEPTELFFARPLEENLFEWHFTIRGPEDTDFEGGIYHGRIILPTEYPMKPPNILMLTPNGRFETNKKICLSISGYHPESWRPSWSIRTALLAIIGFMPTHGIGAIGSLEYSSDERKRLAKASNHFHCDQCGNLKDLLKPLTNASTKDKEEAKSLVSQIVITGEKETESNKTVASEPDQQPVEQTPKNLSSDSAGSSTDKPVFPFMAASMPLPQTHHLHTQQSMPPPPPPLTFEQWLMKHHSPAKSQTQSQLVDSVKVERVRGSEGRKEECSLNASKAGAATSSTCASTEERDSDHDEISVQQRRLLETDDSSLPPCDSSNPMNTISSASSSIQQQQLQQQLKQQQLQQQLRSRQEELAYSSCLQSFLIGLMCALFLCSAIIFYNQLNY